MIVEKIEHFWCLLKSALLLLSQSISATMWLVLLPAIPKGPYCYTRVCTGEYCYTVPCPFLRGRRPNTYCLMLGDYTMDACKECGMRVDSELP